jgi:hypothetical protein
VPGSPTTSSGVAGDRCARAPIELAIRGHDVLRQADAELRACTRLRVELDSHALA